METNKTKMELRDEKDKKSLEEIIGTLSEMVNNMTFDYDEAAKILSSRFICEHRTLQQSMIKLIACFLKNISTFNTDLRNEAAIEWAKKVSQIDSHFPFI
jgi:hypothetical protein